MVDRDRKRELLAHLVKTGNWQQVLVFCKTKHGANRLAQQLEKEGIQADAIHGNKSQPARTKALKRFKDNELQVLVATDIAARGLDIEALPHVVNFDLPHVAEDYVHRIGRTGRAGTSGEAISLVSADDRPLFTAIERLINRKIEQKSVVGFEPTRGASSAPEADDRPRRQPQQRRDQQPRGGAPRSHQPRPSTRSGARDGARPQGARRPDQQPRRPEGARPARPQALRPGARPYQGSASRDPDGPPRRRAPGATARRPAPCAQRGGRARTGSAAGRPGQVHGHLRLPETQSGLSDNKGKARARTPCRVPAVP